VLAGGLGKRLRAAYPTGPKALAPVGPRPFLDYLLCWLRGQGVEEVVLCVGYKRSYIQRYVGSGRKWGLRARYSIEKQLLGTAGAVKKAEGMLGGDSVLVINGDTFLEVNLKKMIRFHWRHKGWATLAVAQVANADRFGILRVDAEGRVTSFLEKGATGANKSRVGPRQYINGGVYVLQKQCFNRISASGQVSLEKKVFPDLVSTGRLFGFVTGGFFLDIGIPEDLEKAQSELPKRLRVSNSH
jgi:NDP-sugar pyrophosphorylase family protein